ncbi:hypothetical protein J2X76_006005 [Neorhizobium sp. 2083]|uniref:hypothetical protein n=1 Tax=Neorhizobium sp. 2083 TaxID=2817762 RepID=UPI0028631C73|nr:hypothetical protein [Neorhizobium sp. 2083]MDR6820805.1 hypothetical protein [Neorhizobium sp. 2083]
MLLKHVQVLDPIEPEEMEMLQRVFDQVCNVRGFRKQTPEAVDVARLIMNLYQHGIRLERQLIAMVL